MKKFRIIENFTTAVVTEIEIANEEYIDVFNNEQHLIQLHCEKVADWDDIDYCREVAGNADDSEFEIEEITE